MNRPIGQLSRWLFIRANVSERGRDVSTASGEIREDKKKELAPEFDRAFNLKRVCEDMHAEFSRNLFITGRSRLPFPAKRL